MAGKGVQGYKGRESKSTVANEVRFFSTGFFKPEFSKTDENISVGHI